MDSGISSFLRLLFLLWGLAVAATAAATAAAVAPVCPAPSLAESLLPLRDSCSRISSTAFPGIPSSGSRVVELGDGAPEQVFSNESFTAVLFYASWCHFSKQLKPVFESLSMVFPMILHVAVEESSIKPGLLSKYGVYSFPVLYIHNGTSRFRYSGPRSLEHLTLFYTNTTGMEPSKLTKTKPNHQQKIVLAEPSFSERLHNDTYLALASWFLVFRVLVMVLPMAVTRVKIFWERCHLYRVMTKPRGLNDNQAAAERSLKNRRERTRRRLSVPGWSHQITSPSSSLAIAESSARRIEDM